MNTLSVGEARGGREAYDGGLVSHRGSAWIVCAGATRDVSRGRVTCPQMGTVSAIECLACHLLVTVSDERSWLLACSTEDR